VIKKVEGGVTLQSTRRSDNVRYEGVAMQSVRRSDNAEYQAE